MGTVPVYHPGSFLCIPGSSMLHAMAEMGIWDCIAQPLSMYIIINSMKQTLRHCSASFHPGMTHIMQSQCINSVHIHLNAPRQAHKSSEEPSWTAAESYAVQPHQITHLGSLCTRQCTHNIQVYAQHTQLIRGCCCDLVMPMEKRENTLIKNSLTVTCKMR